MIATTLRIVATLDPEAHTQFVFTNSATEHTAWYSTESFTIACGG